MMVCESNRARQWYRIAASVVAAVATFTVPLAAQRPASGSAVRDSAIAAFAVAIETDVASDSAGGITAGVVIGDRVVWVRGFGRADRERGTAATDSTIYRIGSISKSLTALVLMDLVENGTVALDEPVVTYLPEFATLGGGVPEASSITIRQLASHTAGLIREPRLSDAAAGPIAGWEDKVIESIPTTTLQSVPGTEYSYSNIGYGILGLAISRAAHQSFMALMERVLFRPLGMASSTFVIRPPLDRHLAAGYDVTRDGVISGELPALEHAGRGYKVPNGGVYSTVYDLARVIELMCGLRGNDVLTTSSRNEIMRRQTPADGTGYGLGFFLDTDDAGHRVVYHSGGVAGYNAFLAFDPDLGVGVIMLRGYTGGSTNLGRASRELLADLVGEGAEVRRYVPGLR